MKHCKILFLLMAAMLVVAPAAWSTPVLKEYAVNVNSDLSTPLGINANGLGTISISKSGAGVYSILSFFDYDINDTQNTFFNEYGATSGSAGTGQTWEIDEPGWRILNPGDIYDNFLAGTLDSTNNSISPDDVSLAMGWNFTLAANQSALVRFTISDVAPTSGFYLQQTDPGYGLENIPEESIYLSSTLDIRDTPTGVPEPASLILLGLGLAGLAVTRKR